MVYDVILIGGGVVGAAVARYLSRYRGSFLLLERNEDLCTGTSKANSGIVHAGFDCKPGTWKARCNVAGSRMMADLARELDFPYRRNGSLVLCFDPADRPKLEALKAQGERNGVEGLELLTGDQARALEPNLSKACAAALHAPAGAIVCPFGLTYALAENAADNGVAFRFDTPVTGLTRRGDRWQVETPRGSFETRAVVNAAGVYAAEIHNWVSGRKLCITPRRGQYLLLDREAGGHIDHTIFQLPGPLGKGVLVTPTVHGNLLLGPTAEEIDDFEGVDTTAAGLETVARRAAQSVERLPLRSVITAFAGLRAHETGGDFVLGEPEDAPGFFDCAGIESPGLSSAPAIGLWMAERLQARLNLPENPDFNPNRRGILDPRTLPFAQRQALIAADPAYGRIICRCEEISEGEIREAIRRGARSLDGVKRRTRAGMGRCQGGFCAPRVMELLAEAGIDPLTKSGGRSWLLAGPKGEEALHGTP